MNVCDADVLHNRSAFHGSLLKQPADEGRNLMSLKGFVSQHPQLTAWAVLAVGMVIILIWAAKDVGLLPGQWAALIVTTILLAGLCVWIIGWNGEDEVAEDQ